MTRRGRRAREADLVGWEGLALAILESGIRARDWRFLRSPWARMLAAGLGVDDEWLDAQIERAFAARIGRHGDAK